MRSAPTSPERARALATAAVFAVVTVGACSPTQTTGTPSRTAEPAPTVTVTVTKEAAASPQPAAETAVPAGFACQLVTKPEAERLAGTKLGKPEAVRDTCSYLSSPGGPTAQVEVYVGPGAKKFLDIERDLGHKLRPLGVGDESWATDEAVFVAKDGQWASVRLVRLNDPEDNRAPLAAQAKTVAERMGP